MLGKIQSARYGFGGYQDAMLGVDFTLGGDGWGVGDFWGVWADRSDGAKWTLEDRSAELARITDRLRDLLRDAKVQTLDQLAGRPVEVFFNGGKLSNWRILKEVL